MSNESGASFLLCSLGWRAMEEENEGESQRGMSEREHLGHFWKGAGVCYSEELTSRKMQTDESFLLSFSRCSFLALCFPLSGTSSSLFSGSPTFPFSSSQILPTARKTHYSRHLPVTLAFQLTNPPKRRSNAFQPTNPPKRRSNPSSKRVTCREYLLPSTNPISPFCEVSSSGTRRISSP